MEKHAHTEFHNANTGALIPATAAAFDEIRVHAEEAKTQNRREEVHSTRPRYLDPKLRARKHRRTFT